MKLRFSVNTLQCYFNNKYKENVVQTIKFRFFAFPFTNNKLVSINIDTFESDYDAFPVRLPKYHHSKGELNFFPEIICGGKFLKADWLKLHATA
jgi:hypothetical protein